MTRQARELPEPTDPAFDGWVSAFLAGVDTGEGQATRRATGARSQGKAAKVARAAELRAAGHTVPRIAQLMTDEGLIRGSVDPARSVRRWLAVADSRTERERSVSR